MLYIQLPGENVAKVAHSFQIDTLNSEIYNLADFSVSAVKQLNAQNILTGRDLALKTEEEILSLGVGLKAVKEAREFLEANFLKFGTNIFELPVVGFRTKLTINSTNTFFVQFLASDVELVIEATEPDN